MKVIISAGGTGGHIYPALAIIEKIKENEPDSEFIYIGTHNRMEKDIVPKYGIPYEEVEIYGFFKKNLFKNFKTLGCLIKAQKKCEKIIKNFKPDVVIGVGGYVTVPVVLAAKKLGVKTFLHEQNILPGKSNVFLSKKVDKIGVSFEKSLECFDKDKVVLTGNPCSESALKIKAKSKKEFNLKEDKPLVLFVMGSLGATFVNDFLVNTMILFNNKNYEVLFVTGKNDYERISNLTFPSNVKVVPFVDGLPGIMKKTDVMVTRAGASTMSEIIALEIPSIIIPSPYVANNHQEKNALDLVEKNAAYMVLEKDLKGDILVRYVDTLINDINKLDEIKSNLNKMKISNSGQLIYEELKSLVKGSK